MGWTLKSEGGGRGYVLLSFRNKTELGMREEGL